MRTTGVGVGVNKLSHLRKRGKRVRPFFKVFEAQPCAGRSHWGLSWARGYQDFNWVMFTFASKRFKEHVFYTWSIKYLFCTLLQQTKINRTLAGGKGKRCPNSKILISSFSAHWASPVQGWVPKTLKKGRTLVRNSFTWFWLVPCFP